MQYALAPRIHSVTSRQQVLSGDTHVVAASGNTLLCLAILRLTSQMLSDALTSTAMVFLNLTKIWDGLLDGALCEYVLRVLEETPSPACMLKHLYEPRRSMRRDDTTSRLRRNPTIIRIILCTNNNRMIYIDANEVTKKN